MKIIVIAMLLLFTSSAYAVTVQVEKRGLGSASLTSEIGECGSSTPVCTYNLELGDSIGLLYQRDSTGAQLMGWGGACLPYEDSLTCTVTITPALQQRYPGIIPIIAGLGYAQDGACRAPGGIWDYMYFPDLYTAYNALKGAVVNNPIDCKVQDVQTLSSDNTADNIVDTDLVFSGGWDDFTPNSQNTGLTIWANSTIITTGTLTITGGLGIACGWTIKTSPYVVTTPLTIGATPCDYGWIIR